MEIRLIVNPYRSRLPQINLSDKKAAVVVTAVRTTDGGGSPLAYTESTVFVRNTGDINGRVSAFLELHVVLNELQHDVHVLHISLPACLNAFCIIIN